MAYDGRYDDPKYINAFLADLRLTDEELAEGVDNKQNGFVEEGKNETVAEPIPGSKTSSGINTPAATSPPAGLRAPPPTPEGVAWKATTLEHLPSISEDQSEERKHLTSTYKQPATIPRLSPKATPFIPSSAKSGDSGVATNTDVVPGIIATVRGLQGDNIHNYHQYNIEKFKVQGLGRAALLALDGKASTGDNGDSAQDESTAMSDGSDDDDDSSVNIVVDAPTTPESYKSRKSIPILGASGKSSDSLNKIATQRSGMIQETSAAATGRNSVQEEPREHAVYFPTWGTPSERSIQAHVRKVIITGLPTSTDFTLVQSLIHGGTIDEMTISQSPSSNGTITATVIFVEPKACDAYFDAYPNGLEFRYKGTKYVASVYKSKDVNVIPGVLQTYLNFGATRVVKVSKADQDWSMRALYKLAGGPDGDRKVETINDNCSADDRTIFFRFTKIVDAVAFRTGLIGDADWEHATVEFAADPCKKATGVHTE